jgi:hypothetical protein
MQFQLHRNGQTQTLDLDALRQLARDGHLAQDEWVFDERTNAWVGAVQIAEMRDAWNLAENERTVAVQLSPETLAALAAQQAANTAKAAAAKAAAAAASPAPVSVPAPAPVPASVPASVPAPAPVPTPAKSSRHLMFAGIALAVAVAVAAAVMLIK